MSDSFTQWEQVKEKLQLEDRENSLHLHYIYEQRVTGAFLTFKISQKLLLKWRELKKLFVNISYLDLLHLSSLHVPFSIKHGDGRVEEYLRTLVSKVYNRGKGLRGVQRAKFLLKERSVQLYHHELESNNSLYEKFENEKNELQSQIHELEMDMNEMCDKLWQEIQNERSRVQNLESESLKLIQENEGLKEYIDYLEDSVVCGNCSDTLRNTGKPLNEVSARQVTRKIKELKTTAQKALWFLQSFGLTLDSIKVRDKEGTVTELDYEGNNGSASFDNLPEDEKETVRALLYIMDKFCVSDAAYHEVTQISDDIPRSYLIKQCRSDLNNSFHIRRTPGKNSGVEMSFKQELEAQIRKKLAQGDLGRQQIKISGDGAKMSRIANFIVISFAMLSDGEKVMSCKGKWCICNGYLNQVR
ncbi:uncharacterized protein [Acropora muricata]|uniref:uncharacterized protein isoform X1 n=1 Tax=Acropora muricata TaxID=159855 RepID=UPI0034E433CE